MVTSGDSGAQTRDQDCQGDAYLRAHGPRCLDRFDDINTDNERKVWGGRLERS